MSASQVFSWLLYQRSNKSITVAKEYAGLSTVHMRGSRLGKYEQAADHPRWNCRRLLHLIVIKKADKCEQRRGLRSLEHAMTVRDLTGRGASCGVMPSDVKGKTQNDRYLLDKGNLRVTEVCCSSVAIDTFANIALLQSHDLA